MDNRCGEDSTRQAATSCKTRRAENRVLWYMHCWACSPISGCDVRRRYEGRVHFDWWLVYVSSLHGRVEFQWSLQIQRYHGYCWWEPYAQFDWRDDCQGRMVVVFLSVKGIVGWTDRKRFMQVNWNFCWRRRRFPWTRLFPKQAWSQNEVFFWFRLWTCSHARAAEVDTGFYSQEGILGFGTWLCNSYGSVEGWKWW